MKFLLVSLSLFLFTLTLPAKEINHVVICWYEKPIDYAIVKEAIAAASEFEKIPGILAVKAGTTVYSNRDIVDDSFTFGVYIRANGKESLENYLTHPIHKAYVEKFVKGKAKRVTVYDF